MKLFPRRVARFAAVQATFYYFMRWEMTVDQIIGEFKSRRFPGGRYVLFEDDPQPLDINFFSALVSGTAEKGEELECLIEQVLPQGWVPERLESATRCILRCAAFELAHHPKTPREVIINEYVTVAHAFLPEKGPAFVNGVLDALSRGIRSEAGRE